MKKFLKKYSPILFHSLFITIFAVVIPIKYPDMPNWAFAICMALLCPLMWIYFDCGSCFDEVKEE